MKDINIKNANELFKTGKYHQAIEQYEEICKTNSTLSETAQFNIKLALKKIEEKSIKKTHVEPKNKNSNINYKKTLESNFYKDITSNLNQFIEPNISSSNYLVSIVVPVRNASSYIQESINSLTNQTHTNIEIIIVDDYSDDDTYTILKKLSQKDNRIKPHRLNVNMGTYFCRSYGVSVAKGEFITFNDADDISHHLRVELHIQQMLRHEKDITTSNYIRFSPSKIEPIETHGKIEHYGFITTFARRAVFEKIGMFDLTTRAGDVEFSLRLKKYYEKEKIMHFAHATYLAAQMSESLTFSEINHKEKEKGKSLSYSRRRYLKHFTIEQRFFKTIKGCKNTFDFPMLRSPYRLPNLLKTSVVDDNMIVGCMCTIPSRVEAFKKAFSSIICQVDKLFIYPDKYENPLPEEIIKNNKVTILSNKKHPNLGAGGKFLPLYSGMLDEFIDNVLYYTFDDDIQYPSDYVHCLSKKLKENDFLSIVGVHGTVVKERFENYKEDRNLFHFKKEKIKDELVDVIGTGTTAFKASLLRGFFKENDVFPYMIDISLARVCRRNNIPLLSISRHANWLTDLSTEIPKESISIWNKLVSENATSHTQALLEYSHESWGKKAIKSKVQDRIIKIQSHHETLDSIEIPESKETHGNAIHIIFRDDSTYRISVSDINIEKNEKVKIEVTNPTKNTSILSREVNSLGTSFSVNASLNKVISIHLKNNKKLNIKINIQELYETAQPKECIEGDTVIHAGLATYPPRKNCLNDITQSILHQVDNLYFYLNRYNKPPEEVLEVANNSESSGAIHYILDSDGHPKASGKFRWLRKNGYIFTLDDDIIYPEDYFENMISWIERKNRKAFIGVHAVNFHSKIIETDNSIKSYIKDKFNFSSEVKEIQKVHMLGTGTLAFHSSLVDRIKDEFYFQMNYLEGHENANDESLAIFAKKHNLPMYSIPRKANWLKSNKKMKHGIHEEHFNDPTLSKSTRKLLASGNPWE